MLSNFFSDSSENDPICAHVVEWGVLDSVIWLLVSLAGTVLSISLYSALRYGGELPPDRSALDLLAGQVGLWLPLVLGPALTANKKGRGIVADFGARFRADHLAVGLGVGVATQLGVIAALYWFIGLFVDGDAGAEAEKLVESMDGPFDWILLVVMVAIGAPIVEEFFYRGLLFRSIERATGPWLGVLGSALIFALIHFQWFQFPGLLVVGLIAATMALKTRCLSMPIGFHIGFNGAAAAGLFLMNG